MKTWFRYIRLLIVASVLVAVLVGGTFIRADVDEPVPPGTGESNWSTPWSPAYFSGSPGFIDFEGMTEGQVLGEVIPGVKFVNTNGQDWRIATWSSHIWNGKYPNGAYTSQGDCATWLGSSQGEGKIEFTQGRASFFSCLASTDTGVTVDAYDASDNLIVSSGMCSSNTNTGNMSRVTVIDPNHTANIAYVIVHDTGNYWIIDCVSTDAPGVSTPVPPVPELPAGALFGFGLVGLTVFGWFGYRRSRAGAV